MTKNTCTNVIGKAEQCSSMATASAGREHKRVVLTIENKLKILEMIDKSVSYSIIAEKFGRVKSTVGDIKKSKEKILQFRREMVEMRMTNKPKVMKLGYNEKLDQALYLWFKQKRMQGIPVSEPLLCAKATGLNEMLGGDSSSSASEGWKWRFCRRHGIHKLSIQGEKQSDGKKAIDDFEPKFRSYVRMNEFSLFKSSAVMRQVLIFVFCLMLPWRLALRNQQ